MNNQPVVLAQPQMTNDWNESPDSLEIVTCSAITSTDNQARTFGIRSARFASSHAGVESLLEKDN
jgi:hypothetical protein